jgi:hypothetical protein
MRHDALARSVLIDEDMVRRPMRCMVEDAEQLKAVDYWSDEVRRQGSSEERVVLGEAGRVRLQAAVGEGYPSLSGDLEDYISEPF